MADLQSTSTCRRHSTLRRRFKVAGISLGGASRHVCRTHPLSGPNPNTARRQAFFLRRHATRRRGPGVPRNADTVRLRSKVASCKGFAHHATNSSLHLLHPVRLKARSKAASPPMPESCGCAEGPQDRPYGGLVPCATTEAPANVREAVEDTKTRVTRRTTLARAHAQTLRAGSEARRLEPPLDEEPPCSPSRCALAWRERHDRP